MSETAAREPRRVHVAFERAAGWLTRYDAAHPGTDWQVAADRVVGASPDGTSVEIAVPLPPLDELTVAGLLTHLARPRLVGVVLVRKGGFAVARLDGDAVVESKIGRRHVQGRTKAGGWSQQRFARRRDNQARAAYDAAAEHVQAILAATAAELDLVAAGGDRRAVSSVFEHPPLAALRARPQLWLGGLPDPTRAVLDSAVALARSVVIEITDPPRGS